ncbi:helix-turn-helix domain-containing protein [Flagellimonas sp.]|uniref:helix-turn-helix domain-containing protein n=1 Tax=Flagellimonas sp. TaxID=2058762 RepID=UPI003C7A6808
MKVPVLHIQQFRESKRLNEVYVNSFLHHMELNNGLINKPHSHDFYLCVFFLEGTGVHEIDFKSYDIFPGRIFFMRPGQTHHWKFETQPEGFIFFHSRAFYDLNFLEHRLSDFPFYSSLQYPPVVEAPTEELSSLAHMFEKARLEYHGDKLLREIKILNLINGIYINLSRIYTIDTNLSKLGSERYSFWLNRLEHLIEKHFRREKLPKFYANRLNITTKHLNRVVKETTNKTTSEVISDRVVLESKRLLVHSPGNLTQIAYELEFSDSTYFSKFFKAKTGMTPMAFRKKYT